MGAEMLRPGRTTVADAGGVVAGAEVAGAEVAGAEVAGAAAAGAGAGATATPTRPGRGTLLGAERDSTLDSFRAVALIATSWGARSVHSHCNNRSWLRERAVPQIQRQSLTLPRVRTQPGWTVDPSAAALLLQVSA